MRDDTARCRVACPRLKTLYFDVFNECVIDRPTDTAYYRDARTHLKKVEHDPRLRCVLLFHGEQKLSFCVVHLESEEAVNPLFDRRNKITA